jgi:hypothetical protein
MIADDMGIVGIERGMVIDEDGMMIHRDTERGTDGMNLLDTQTEGNITMTNITTDPTTGDIPPFTDPTPRTISAIHLKPETGHPPPKPPPRATPALPVPNRKKSNSLQRQSQQRKNPQK